MKRLIAIAAVAVLVVMVAPIAWGASYDITKPPPIFDRTPSIISTPIADDTPWVDADKSAGSTGVYWLDNFLIQFIIKMRLPEAEVVLPEESTGSLEELQSAHGRRSSN